MQTPSSPRFLAVYLIILHTAGLTYSRFLNATFVLHCKGFQFTSSSPYESNLRRLIAGLVASTPNNPSLFALINSTTPPKIAGLAQCRPDLTPAVCDACLNQSANRLPTRCGQLLSASIRSDICLLRYTDETFYNVLERQPVFKDEGRNASASFNRRVQALMKSLTASAAENPLRFAAGVSKGSADAEDIYGMGWCSIDMASSHCAQCLDSALGEITGKKRGVFENISCQMRFETYLFFAGSMNSTSPAPSQAAAGGKRSDTAKKLILVVTFAAAALLARTEN